MLRSFSYAKWSVRSRQTASADGEGLGAASTRGRPTCASAFLAAYAEATQGSGLYASFEDVAGLLALFELEKLLYELRYEINNRPDWIHVPAVAGCSAC